MPTLCVSQKYVFFEVAEGGYGAAARCLLRQLASHTARLTADEVDVRAEYVTQSLAVKLQRENALAIARRAVNTSQQLAVPLAEARYALAFAAAECADASAVPPVGDMDTDPPVVHAV